MIDHVMSSAPINGGICTVDASRRSALRLVDEVVLILLVTTTVIWPSECAGTTGVVTDKGVELPVLLHEMMRKVSGNIVFTELFCAIADETRDGGNTSFGTSSLDRVEDLLA